MELILFFIGALCGYAVGDTHCFKEKSLECNRQLQNEFLSDFSFCSSQKRVIGCLTKPAIECDLKLKPLAEKVDSIVREICDKGSKTFEVLDKNKECIIKGVIDRECLEPVMHILEKGTGPKNILRIQKETCRHLDQMTSCTVEKVKKACSENIVTFFRSLYDPAIELHQRFCEEVILPEEESSATKQSDKAALPTFFGPLEFII